MRNYRTNEISELTKQLNSSRNEVSMQGALIIALTRKVTYLENSLEDAQTHYNIAVEAIKKEHDEQITQLSLARASSANNSAQHQHTLLLRRAMVAEAEATKLKAIVAQTAASSAERSTDPEATEKVDRLQDEKRKLTDELQFYREDNARLERQAELLSADLQRHLRNTTSPTATASAKLVSPKLSPSCSRALGKRRVRDSATFTVTVLLMSILAGDERRRRLQAEEQVIVIRTRLAT
jgi:hypothetical protein